MAARPFLLTKSLNAGAKANLRSFVSTSKPAGRSLNNRGPRFFSTNTYGGKNANDTLAGLRKTELH